MPEANTDLEAQEVEKQSSNDLENENELSGQYFIRECEVYKYEYSDCKSMKARFNQWFIFGEFLDCNQWKKDYDNCCKWVDKKDVKAAESLIKSEKQRHIERFKAHYRNDVWKRRESPPSDWAKPLPDWMAKRDENTYLALKAKEEQGGNNVEENSSFCTIM